MKKIIKKVLIGVAAFILIAVAAVLIFVGPWPTYAASDISQQGYYQKNLDAIQNSAALSSFNESPGRLQAGWASAVITPPIGTPLAGFGDRKGAPSTGTHDDLYVKALALSDGVDTVVITGSDMLIIPDTLADAVRDQVAMQTDLTANNILFNASHTHSSLGGWGPGFLGEAFAGEYDETIIPRLADQFTEAIVQAVNDMQPASIGSGSADAEQYIRNRTRDAATDSELSILAVKREDQSRCTVVSFSAHPTVLGGSNMEFSGDYPGYLQRALERETDGFAIYLGGALGSMSNRAPGDASGFEKAEALGEALAALALEKMDLIQMDENPEIASIGISPKLPARQWRISPKWRTSPLLLGFLGMDNDGWFQCLRVGDIYFAGMPADFSGEISARMKSAASVQDKDLWVLSFNGDYLGYVSPDKHYATADKDKEGYEMYLMSWLGPDQEVFFTTLSDQAMAALSEK